MRVICLWLTFALISAPAVAFTQGSPPGRFDHLIKYRDGGVIGIDATRIASLPDDDPLKQEWGRLAVTAGGGGRAWLDDRSGLPTLALVRGVAWPAPFGDGKSPGSGRFLGSIGTTAEPVAADRCGNESGD